VNLSSSLETCLKLHLDCVKSQFPSSILEYIYSVALICSLLCFSADTEIGAVFISSDEICVQAKGTCSGVI
jgi:hypothetical protein